MLKVLLKKQFTEAFRGMFYNSKKKQLRSKKQIALSITLFAFLIVVVLGGAFTAMAIGICLGFIGAGTGWMYFALMSGIAIAIGVAGSVFSTYSGLYLPKDNELLISMPIPIRIIIISRLLNVYLMGTLFSGVVMLPTLIVWWAIAGATVQNVICGVLLLLIVTLIVLSLSCLLGWVVAKISLRLKNKSFVIVLISLLLLGGYYFIYFKAQIWIRELIANAVEYGDSIIDSAYPLYLFGRIGEGDFLATAVYAAATAALLALVLFILSRSFLKIATASGVTPKVKYKEKTAKSRSISGALLGKEFARFTSSPNYMLNSGLGTILLVLFGGFMLIKGGEILSDIGAALSSGSGYIEVVLCAVVMLLATMNDTAAPSVSLEGKSIWLLQSLPVEPKLVLRAKAAMQIILTEIPMLFTVVCCALVTQAPIVNKILMCVVPLAFTVFISMFGLNAGIKHPILEWTNEVVPIKQSGAVAIALFGGWGIVALFAAPYFLIGPFIGPVVYLGVWAVIYAAAAVIMYRRICTKGAEIFARL